VTATEPALAALDVTVAYGERTVLDGASLIVGAGERVALVGPNGAGKSTLLRAMTGVLAPRAGAVRLNGVAIERVHRTALARAIGVVPELVEVPFAMPVEEVVALGRLPHEPPLTGICCADATSASCRWANGSSCSSPWPSPRRRRSSSSTSRPRTSTSATRSR
jgi:ABC-type cobalamin/Fe3+-siderophores transport system ATPase subunit